MTRLTVCYSCGGNTAKTSRVGGVHVCPPCQTEFGTTLGRHHYRKMKVAACWLLFSMLYVALASLQLTKGYPEQLVGVMLAIAGYAFFKAKKEVFQIKVSQSKLFH